MPFGEPLAPQLFQAVSEFRRAQLPARGAERLAYLRQVPMQGFERLLRLVRQPGQQWDDLAAQQGNRVATQRGASVLELAERVLVRLVQREQQIELGIAPLDLELAFGDIFRA